MSRPLELLATTLVRSDDAARHFEHALAGNARIGSTLWIGHTHPATPACSCCAIDPGTAIRQASSTLAVAPDGAQLETFRLSDVATL